MNWVGMRFLNEQILCPFFVSIILIYKSEILGLCLIQFSVFCTFVNVKAVQCCVSQELLLCLGKNMVCCLVLNYDLGAKLYLVTTHNTCLNLLKAEPLECIESGRVVLFRLLDFFLADPA